MSHLGSTVHASCGPGQAYSTLFSTQRSEAKNDGHSRVPLVWTSTEHSKPVLQNGLGAGHWQTEGPAPPNQCRLVCNFPVKRKAVNTSDMLTGGRRKRTLTDLGTAPSSSHLLPCLETEARILILSRFRADWTLHRHCQQPCCHLGPILCQQPLSTRLNPFSWPPKRRRRVC